MTIIPNPIKNFEIKKFSHNLKERKIILNVGRLEHQKDHLTLIKAFSKIATSFPEWDLIIIGEGSLKNEIRKEIDLLNLKKRIFLNFNNFFFMYIIKFIIKKT
jgi:glycosyltransferase involved in cell wall biosynthesis